jgi:ABC-type uncharacterized transport system involved in gliding motility auxiliary subunit
MEINKKSRRDFVIQNLIFIGLFLAAVGLLAWLSHRYNLELDWTATGRHTLSKATVKVLSKMKAPITITAYASGSGMVNNRGQIRDMIDRYKKHDPNIELQFIDPVSEPDKARAAQVKVDGELVVEYQGRREHVQTLTEENLTNTLQRLLRQGERKLVFVTGHGERKPDGQANFDLGVFVQRLKDKGIKAGTVNLLEDKAIPKDTAALVIASPQLAYHPGEVKLIEDYLDKGGNLLWLHEPQSDDYLGDLAKKLGVHFEDGVIVDPTADLLGIDATFAIGRAVDHPITRDFSTVSIFPKACGVALPKGDDWQAQTFIKSTADSWAETGRLAGSIRFDKGKDVSGPLNIGISLSRERPSKDGTDKSSKEKNNVGQQRVVIVCDGDFLSNTYLGNQGNQALGQNIVNWLGHDDTFIDIPPSTAPDSHFTLTQTHWIILYLVFAVLIPVLLVGTGIRIWWKRRKA